MELKTKITPIQIKSYEFKAENGQTYNGFTVMVSTKDVFKPIMTIALDNALSTRLGLEKEEVRKSMENKEYIATLQFSSFQGKGKLKIYNLEVASNK
jgi:hypothetical protein